MILTRTPFRISFAGGGSDLPEFYRRRPGLVLSTTINRSMYIAIHRVAELAALAEELRLALERNALESFGEILDRGWRLKSGPARDITHPVVEQNYARAREAGAHGLISEFPEGAARYFRGLQSSGLKSARAADSAASRTGD